MIVLIRISNASAVKKNKRRSRVLSHFNSHILPSHIFQHHLFRSIILAISLLYAPAAIYTQCFEYSNLKLCVSEILSESRPER